MWSIIFESILKGGFTKLFSTGQLSWYNASTPSVYGSKYLLLYLWHCRVRRDANRSTVCGPNVLSRNEKSDGFSIHSYFGESRLRLSECQLSTPGRYLACIWISLRIVMANISLATISKSLTDVPWKFIAAQVVILSERNCTDLCLKKGRKLFYVINTASSSR